MRFKNKLYFLFSLFILSVIISGCVQNIPLTIDASKDMGCTYDKADTSERVYYIISVHYHHLPLSLIASAFKRGALGQYGAGRLVPKTIYGWLGEMNQYFLTKHNTRDNSGDNSN